MNSGCIVSLADITINKFAMCLNWLYEQKKTAPDLGRLLMNTRGVWWRWVLAATTGINSYFWL